MSRLRRIVRDGLLVSTLAAAATAITAAAASASTFYVSPSGNDSHPCTSPAEPCLTINAAVEKSESAPAPTTIEVAAGTYEEEVELAHPADNGITVNGAGSGAGGTEIKGKGKTATKPTIRVVLPEGSATLAHLRVVNPSEDKEPGMVAEASVTLNDVSVDMQTAESEPGIEAGELGLGALTINSSSVTMESGNSGAAIEAILAPLSVSNTTITLAEGAKGSGLLAEASNVTLNGMTISVPATATQPGIAVGLGKVAITNVSLTDNATSEIGAVFPYPESMTASGLKVAMTNAANEGPAVEQVFGIATFDRLEVSGAWTGSAFAAEGGRPTLQDSRLATNPAATGPAVAYAGMGEGPGLLLRRDVLQANPTALPGALALEEANATLDSSEVLGGSNAIALEQTAGRTRTLTVAGSTIDAGNAGARDAGAFSVNVLSAGTLKSTANVNIEGSILFEPQKAEVGAGENAASVTCSNSDVPNQTQAATATEGAIACTNGANGNTTTEPLTALFGPSVTNYAPIFGSSAVDGVPAGAISLPFGIEPSPTDLLGNPRVVDGNGDCVALQDKGAIELQGHSATCPSPPAKPVAGSITNLHISPNAFYAAPSGATISKKHKAKRKYGATVSYNDSQAAVAKFTIVESIPGRMQGKSCKKPSRKNRRGKRCTLHKALRGFSRVDKVGSNKFHFSGRLNGQKLGKGSYTLQVVPHNAAGNGKAVSKQFKIK